MDQDPRIAPNTPALPDQVRRLLRAVRQEYPATVLQTEPVRVDDDAIVIRATVQLPMGARGSGIASARTEPAAWTDQLAEVEAQAVINALETLAPLLDKAIPAAATPTQKSPRQIQEAPPTVVSAVRRAAQGSPGPAPAPSAAAASTPDDDIAMAEYSWNSFWKIAKARGITPDRVRSVLGVPPNESTPADAVAALRTSGDWQ